MYKYDSALLMLKIAPLHNRGAFGAERSKSLFRPRLSFLVFPCQFLKIVNLFQNPRLLLND